MIRLERKFASLKENSQKALVAYLVAGDPDISTTLELMHQFVLSGVDIIELGVPFTDPIAEGPIIQAAHDRALQVNTSLDMIFSLVEEFRRKDSETPIILMGYINTFLANSKALESIHERGTDAVLIVDVPGESSLEDIGIQNKNIASISLISPTTDNDRIQNICMSSSGFIYYVTLRGVTGASNLNENEIRTNILNIRNSTNLPVLAGFGIKTASDARALSQISDGVVIGSVLVEMIQELSENKDYKKIYNYLNEISAAINP
ncbi:tryptophan synthase subunit alpha [Gammaproteobacteria bacterium]|nr:tryptophan synthase subunit alpha [Gammaproteobacteria bacterium]MDB0028639.1 tryptophan synthase subunit alpha [bacterium]MDB4183757.1 tryptophan synthase subunit alpha [Gammaproteobacteria bacterium]